MVNKGWKWSVSDLEKSARVGSGQLVTGNRKGSVSDRKRSVSDRKWSVSDWKWSVSYPRWSASAGSGQLVTGYG